jgi:hypothetical protein
MTRLLCTMLLCALGTAQASAQTAVSQQLLELEDDERNAAFTLMLQDGRRKCDQVVRTLFLKAPSWAWTSGRRCVETAVPTHLLCWRNRMRP